MASARITRSDDLRELPLLDAIERNERCKDRRSDQNRVQELPGRRRTTSQENIAVRFEQPSEGIETQEAPDVRARLRKRHQTGTEEEEHPDEAEQERLQLAQPKTQQRCCVRGG